MDKHLDRNFTKDEIQSAHICGHEYEFISHQSNANANHSELVLRAYWNGQNEKANTRCIDIEQLVGM